MSLTDLSDESAPRVGQATTPTMPRPPASRDKVLPIFIVVSLIVHATIMLPSMLRNKQDEVAPPPKEIPVEVVQEMPQPPAPKAAEKPPAPKPQPQQQQPKAAETPKPESVAERLKDLLGSMPAIPLPSNSPVGSDDISYSQLVLSKLAKAKREGRYQHAPGAAGVDFTLGDLGEVVKVEIRRSSGDKWIDDEAIAMVKRGAPYPPPPPGAERDFVITLSLKSVI